MWEYEKKQCLIRINKSKAASFDNSGNVLASVYIKDDGKGQNSGNGGQNSGESN